MPATRLQEHRARETKKERRAARFATSPGDAWRATPPNATKMEQDKARKRRWYYRVARNVRARDPGEIPVCVACLEPMTERVGDRPGDSTQVTYACDHPIHNFCHIRHTNVHLERIESALVDAVDAERRQHVRFFLRLHHRVQRDGAPCPACRCPFPFGHNVCAMER